MFDLNTSILDAEYEEEVDEERLEEYIDEVMNEFVESPEGDAFCERFDSVPGYAALYMHYMGMYFGATVVASSALDTREVVFDLIPRKVSVEPEQAPAIIGELQLFWQFLKRTRSLPQADRMLELFDESAADRLQERLGDTGRFGMAKSLVMAGKAAGFDMTTQEGLAAFTALYNSSLLSDLEPETEEEPVAEQVSNRLSPAPIRNESAKVGRNEPCPCGSGRKFKKCCGK